MSPNLKMVLLVLTMAGVTYLIRAIPFAFFRKKIKSASLCSVLFYVPFPYILYSTGNIYTALVGTVVALIASVCKRSILIVALLSCFAVFISGLFL